MYSNVVNMDTEDWLTPEEDELLLQALHNFEEENENQTTVNRENNLHSDQKQMRWKVAVSNTKNEVSVNKIEKDCVESCPIVDNETSIPSKENFWNKTCEAKVSTGEDINSKACFSDKLPNSSPNNVASNQINGVQSGKDTVDQSKDHHRLGDGAVSVTPLERYRGNSLKVTDITAQAWCEQQLAYSLTVPREVLQTPAMERGTAMHSVKELEVHDIEEIPVETREDSFAVKVLNMYSALLQLVSGSQKVREMPIFGEPFGLGVFFSGIIDEVRWKDDGELEIVEFKTRVRSKTLPSSAQRKTHRLQVSLYKHLFDLAVKGLVRKESITENLKLNLDKTLSHSVLDHVKKIGLESHNLNGVLHPMLEKFRFLQTISCLTTEYTSQTDFTSFASESYEYDEDWLRRHIEKSLQFWKGERHPVGVDIEDAWKCQHCFFEETCEWRQKMHEDCISKNSIKRVKLT